MLFPLSDGLTVLYDLYNLYGLYGLIVRSLIMALHSWLSTAGGRGGVVLSWIFIHGTDILDRGSIVLFSVFFANFWFFSIAPPPPLKKA